LLVSRSSRKSGLAEVEVIAGPSSGQKLKRNPQDVGVFLGALNVIREDNVDFEQLPELLKDALSKYTDLLTEHRQLDYSRIMMDALAALYDDAPDRRRLQETLGKRVRYLTIDEYQDVNPLQERLIRRLQQLGANVCVVGDDDQAIYQWRGSEIRNILDFAKRYTSVRSITLADNFRSSAGVVNAGRLLAEKNDPDRLPKTMNAAGHQPFERGDLLALTAPGYVRHEVRAWRKRAAQRLVQKS